MSSVIIRLQNLPISANASNIRRFFTGLSIPEGGVHIVGGEKGDAFIAFATDEDARRAMLLDRQQINNVSIRLFLSSKTEMQSVIDTARNSVMMAAQQPVPTPSLHNLSEPNKFTNSSQPVAKNTYPDDGSSFYPQKPTHISSRPPPYQSFSQTVRPNERNYDYDQYRGHNEGNDRIPPEAPHAPGDTGDDDYSYYEAVNDGCRSARETISANGASSGFGRHGSNYKFDHPYQPPDSGYGDPSGPYRRGETQSYSNVERDFSVRPPWLSDQEAPVGRSYPPKRHSYEAIDELPIKRNRGDEILSLNLDSCFVVKVSMCPTDVLVKHVFEILRGVNIVPRFGIRVEEDSLKRYTGNVYCLLSTREAFKIAIEANGCSFHGKPVKIIESTVPEFFSLTDSSFQSRCPPQYADRIPPRASTKPNFHADGCIEMIEVPSDTSKQDIVSFLGAPGLVVDDVKISPPQESGSVRVFVKLPSARDLDILMSAPPRPYGPKQTRNVELIPVSRMQFLYASQRPGVMQPDKPPSHPTQPVIRSEPSRPQDAHIASPKTEPKSCAFLYGLVTPMTSFDICKLFPSVNIPGDSIHVMPNNTAAVIDFISESNCKKALLEFANTENNLKAIHRNICMRSISRKDFEQKRATATSPSNAAQEEPTTPGGPPSASTTPNQRPPFTPSASHRFSGPPTGTRNGPHFRPPPPQQVNLHVANIPPKCSPDAVLDVFRPFRPLPGSLRFRRDSAGNLMGEALIAFGSYPEAERVQREVNGYRLFGRHLTVRIQ